MSVAEQTQVMQALVKANDYRLRRAALKREVKAGKRSLAELFAGRIPTWLRNMQVEELLTSAHRFPRKTAHKAIWKAGASLTATVGGLTTRQRGVIAAELAEWEARRA